MGPYPLDVMPDRTFSKDEVTALLERTAELERTGRGRRDPDATGLTVTELEHVAREAGLDVDHLRAAIAELDERTSLSGAHRDQTATHNTLERWVDGAVTDDVWADLVMELRNRFDTELGMSMGMPGFGMSTAETLGRNRQWRHTSLAGVETRILLREINGRTRIRLSQKVGIASPMTESLMYGGILAAAGAAIAAAAMKSGMFGLVALLAMMALFVPVILMLDKGWRRKKHNELAVLSEEIVRHIRSAEPQTALEAGTERDATSVLLDVEDPIQDTEDVRDPARERVRP